MSYSPQVIDHFNQPHHYGRLENPDGVGEVGNLTCGDVMRIYIQVSEGVEGEPIIKDIMFETFGCVAAIATSSMICDLAYGKSLTEAMKIKNEDIVDQLGDLPQPKIHCSVLAADALAEAIFDYLFKHKLDIPEALQKRHQHIMRTQASFQEV
ncbi:MAG TPA: iron-sulfur cluster assembly scaffold protein [Candidatus Woesebacteria bacterium]|nr:iron-sulfur cluster assembly scaffold protein [Candidatus Woesebacteria bacterium]